MVAYPDPETEFVICKEYTASDVRSKYGGSNGKGIIKGRDNDYVFLFSTQKSHKDDWSKKYPNIFLYHGAGEKKGSDGRYLDQNYDDSKQGNSYILKAFLEKRPVYLFRSINDKTLY